MATSDNMLVRYVKETSYGFVAPSTKYKRYRFTNITLRQDTETVESQEITSNRATADVPRVGASVSGDLTGELSFGTHDDFILAALQANRTWTDIVIDDSVEITITAGGVLTAASGDLWALLEVGDTILIAGASNSGNNGYKRITAKTGLLQITVTSPTTLVNETFATSGGTSITRQQSGYQIDDTVPIAVNAAGTYTFTSSAQNWAGVKVGQWIRVNEAATGNSGFKKVLSITTNVNPSDTLTVTANTGMTTEVLGASDGWSVDIIGDVTNGKLFETFDIEVEHTDETGVFRSFSGCGVESFNLSVGLRALFQTSFGFVGRIGRTASSTNGDGADTAATTTQLLNAVDHVELMLADGTLLPLRRLEFTTANNLRPQEQLGTFGPTGMGSGTFSATGSFELLYTDNVLLAKYLAYDSVPVAFAFQDTAGNAYVVDFPAARLTEGDPNPGGRNQDVVARYSFSSYEDATEGVQMRVGRLAAA